MKKLLIILLLFSLLLGLLASCAPNDTSSVGEISGDVSTTVEVTDEAVIAEIKALLEKYNEYVLIVNMCEGSLEYDKDDVYEVNITLTPLSYDGDDPYYLKDNCIRITDERYDSVDKLLELYDVFVSDIKEYLVEFEFEQDVPRFIEWDGIVYTVNEFKSSCALPQRYVDTGSTSVVKTENGYIVTVKGASRYTGGKVGEYDSTVRFSVIDEGGELKISHISRTKGEFSNEDGTDEERLIRFVETFNEFAFLADESSRFTDEPYDIPIVIKGYLFNCEYYLVNSQKFTDVVDVYDRLYTLFDQDQAFSRLNYLCSAYHPEISMINEPPFFAEKDGKLYSCKHTYMMTTAGYIPFDVDGLKYVETDYGYLIYCEDDTSLSGYKVSAVHKVDVFGNGGYELKFNSLNMYPTAEELQLIKNN